MKQGLARGVVETRRTREDAYAKNAATAVAATTDTAATDEVDTAAEFGLGVVGVELEALGVVVAAPGALVTVLELEEAEPLHETLAQRDGSDFLVASPGWDTPVVHSTFSFEPATHAQHGSPSSWPFV